MFKVNNRNTRTRCEIFSKLTIKTPESIIREKNLHFPHSDVLCLSFLLGIMYVLAGLLRLFFFP